MNNLTNTILTKVANFAEMSGVITNVADNLLLLSYVLPKDNVAAQACRKICGSCRCKDINWVRTCRTCCGSFPAVGCYKPFTERCGYCV